MLERNHKPSLLYSQALPTGTNTVQWRYSKDASYGSGQDAGWVDPFSFLPDPPVITLQPISQTVNLGANLQFRVTVTGATPLTYQSEQNLTNPVGVNSVRLNLSSVGRVCNGLYSVRVSNPGGDTFSRNALLKALVPQQLSFPTRPTDGTFQLTSGDADGGWLTAADLPNFTVLTSTNLLNWEPLTNAPSLTNGRLWWQDDATTNYPQKFYRVRENPGAPVWPERGRPAREFLMLTQAEIKTAAPARVKHEGVSGHAGGPPALLAENLTHV